MRKSAGMTLIELLIVVTIVGVIGGLAVSSYRSYLVRANRTDAKVALLQLQTAQEKYFLQNARYASAGALTTAPPSGLGLNSTTLGGKYRISISAATALTYTATAQAQGAQANSDPSCGTMTIDNTGARTPSPDPNRCWK